MSEKDRDIDVHIYDVHDHVIIDFRSKLTWIGLTPKQALQFARRLIKQSNRILEKKKNEKD